MQDWLGLDNRTRMNTPGTVDSNWAWRLNPKDLTKELQTEIRNVSKRYARANWDALNALEAKKSKA